jgi:hypothetical protein
VTEDERQSPEHVADERLDEAQGGSLDTMPASPSPRDAASGLPTGRR